MKRSLSVFLSLILVLMAFSFVSCGNETTSDTPDAPDVPDITYGKTLYVSPDGDDANDGTETSPLASFAGARDAVRKLKAESGLPENGVCVLFAAGEYFVNSTTEFTAEDSGEAGKPIVYKAAPGAEVSFNGGTVLKGSDFAPAAEEIKAQLPDKTAAENLLEIDLAAAGCYDLTPRYDYEREWRVSEYRQELYVDGKRQTIARWPNTGFATVTKHTVDDGTGDVYFEIPADKAEMLSKQERFGYFGYPQYDWSMLRLSNMTSDNIDLDSSSIILKGFRNHLRVGATYCIYDVLPELDVPGEYYWDPDTNKLYYYPDGSLEGKKIVFSQYASNWFVLSGVSYLNFEGMTFENGRATVFTNGDSDTADHIRIADCTLRCMGADVIYMNCSSMEIVNNEIYEIGGAAVTIVGGSLKTLDFAGSVVSNNLIHDWSQTYTICNPGIQLKGFGFQVDHNELYNSPHQAIAFDCSESIIEYNYVHDVCRETSDAGAIYAGRRWDWRGNIIRYNYIRDIIDVTCGGQPNAIYLDDQLAGQTCYGNVIVNVAGRGMLIGGGRDNIIYNNIIIDTGKNAIVYDDRGVGTNFAGPSSTYPDGFMWVDLIASDYLSKLHRYYFPENLCFIESYIASSENNIYDPGTPSYSYMCRNVCRRASDSENILATGMTRTDEMGYLVSSADAGKIYGTFIDNVAYSSGVDMGFVDEENGNYALREDSVIFRDIMGFENIPFDQIGRITK